jgi:hypothetical protein
VRGGAARGRRRARFAHGSDGGALGACHWS